MASAGTCAVHVQKIQGQGLGGIRNHMMRTGESRTNPDIDKARSPQNWAVDGMTANHLERQWTITPRRLVFYRQKYFFPFVLCPYMPRLTP